MYTKRTTVRPQSNMLKNFSKMIFWEFPKLLPNMLSMLPIMLVLCSNMNDFDAKFYYLSAILEYLRYNNMYFMLFKLANKMENNLPP